MRLELVRSGGFAGLETHAALEVGELPAEQARQVTEALRALGGSGPAASRGARAGRADGFQYDLTVLDGAERKHWTLHDGAIPAGLRPVLDLVLSRGRKG